MTLLPHVVLSIVIGHLLWLSWLRVDCLLSEVVYDVVDGILQISHALSVKVAAGGQVLAQTDVDSRLLKLSVQGVSLQQLVATLSRNLGPGAYPCASGAQPLYVACLQIFVGYVQIIN